MRVTGTGTVQAPWKAWGNYRNCNQPFIFLIFLFRATFRLTRIHIRPTTKWMFADLRVKINSSAPWVWSVFSFIGGVHIGTRALHVLDLIWFGCIARLYEWGGEGKFFPRSNDFYLPWLRIEGGGGGWGGWHPVMRIWWESFLGTCWPRVLRRPVLVRAHEQWSRPRSLFMSAEGVARPMLQIPPCCTFTSQ